MVIFILFVTFLVENDYKIDLGSIESTNEGQFLCVPNSSITASSSAETLTDNTITAPSTPTNLSNRSVPEISQK